MDDRLVYLALAFAVGLVVGAGGVSVADAGPADAAPELGEDPPSWYATVGSRPPAPDVYPDAGWLHEVQVDDEMIVTGNASVVHDADEDVAVKAEAVGPQDYAIRIVTEPAEEQTKGEGPGRSRVQWGTSVPSDYGTIRVWANGERVLTVENDDASTPRLFYLPNPVNQR